MAMSRTAKTLLILGGILVVFVVVCAIGIAIFYQLRNKPSVPQNSVLVMKVSGDMPDYTPQDPTAELFGVVQQQSLVGFISSLKYAKTDSRIGAVMIDVDFPGIGWGKADEIREAIADFKTSGKPVYGFMEIGSNKEYYIAAACDKIYLPPPGDLYINGLAADVMFYKGTLDKIGVEMDVVQIGKYKSAPETYTRKEMSDGHREVMNAILDDYYNRIVAAIADGRKKSPEDVKAIIDNAPYGAAKAKEQGLIDDALYRDQVYDQFKTALGYKEGTDLRTIGGREYREAIEDTFSESKAADVAVIFASGPINVGHSSSGGFGGEATVGSDTIVKAVNDAAEDKSIKAIILRVDSPGGSALASDLMWHALENAKAKKPVVVSMSDVAASGGYYIACNANKIVAEPSTITGSIGVFMGKPVVKGLFDWAGITSETLKRGKNSGLFDTSVKWNADERAKIEESAHKIYYEDFVPKVSKGRNKTVEEIDAIGQGHVWTGAQAKQNGLIDEFGGFEKAVEVAKELAGISADKSVRRVVFPAPRPFFETFLNNGDEDAATSASSIETQKAQKAMLAALPEDARRMFRFTYLFDQLKMGDGLTLLPFDLRIR
jgi:protease-4